MGHIVLGLVEDDDATPQQTVEWLLNRQEKRNP
jgi:hypothetical protein